MSLNNSLAIVFPYCRRYCQRIVNNLLIIICRIGFVTLIPLLTRQLFNFDPAHRSAYLLWLGGLIVSILCLTGTSNGYPFSPISNTRCSDLIKKIRSRIKDTKQLKGNRMKKTLSIMVVGAMVASNAMATLLLEIDAANTQFRLSGADSGVASYDDNFSVYVMGWGRSDAKERYLDGASDLFAGSYSVEAFTQDYSAEAPTSFTIYSTSSFTTVLGSGLWVDYSSMDETYQSDFEGLIGESLAVASNFGPGIADPTGWSSISVAAVPDPASVALLGIASALGLFIRRIFMM